MNMIGGGLNIVEMTLADVILDFEASTLFSMVIAWFLDLAFSRYNERGDIPTFTH